MEKKLDELPLAGCIHAPFQRGSVSIYLSSCLSCNQGDPAKISVLCEENGKIIHSMGKREGDDGTIYELRCDVCNYHYKIGVISVEGMARCGSTEISSVFLADEKSKWKWGWLGYF